MSKKNKIKLTLGGNKPNHPKIDKIEKSDEDLLVEDEGSDEVEEEESDEPEVVTPEVIVQVPSIDTSTFQFTCLKESIRDSKLELEELLGSMRDVNINIHPLKANVLHDWRERLNQIIEKMPEVNV